MSPICTKPVLCRDFYMWSLIYMYYFVEYSLCVLQTGENQKSILYFCLKLWNFKNSENLKAINIEKMALTEKEPYFKMI